MEAHHLRCLFSKTSQMKMFFSSQQLKAWRKSSSDFKLWRTCVVKISLKMDFGYHKKDLPIPFSCILHSSTIPTQLITRKIRLSPTKTLKIARIFQQLPPWGPSLLRYKDSGTHIHLNSLLDIFSPPHDSRPKWVSIQPRFHQCFFL